MVVWKMRQEMGRLTVAGHTGTDPAIGIEMLIPLYF